MFGVKELRAEVERLRAEVSKLRGEIEATDRDVEYNHGWAASKSDLALLLAHLKLEINTLPATPEKRVVEKAGTQAKRGFVNGDRFVFTHYDETPTKGWNWIPYRRKTK